jgi:hypothetical protein
MKHQTFLNQKDSMMIQLRKQFDQLTEALDQHKQLLVEKLQDLVIERIGEYYLQLEENKFYQTALKKGQKIVKSQEVALIVKDVSQLYKVLLPICSKAIRELIFENILRTLTHQVDQFYSQLDCSSKSTQKKVKIDLKYYDNQIAALGLEIN